MREGNNPLKSSSKLRALELPVRCVKLVGFALKILRAENLKNPQNSAIIYIESERDVTLPF